MIAFLKTIVRAVIYCLAFVLPIIALAGYGYMSTLSLTLPKPAALTIPATGDNALNAKPYDPAKPTVAIVLGSSRTESTDFLIPYELFSAAGASPSASAPAPAQCGPRSLDSRAHLAAVHTYELPAERPAGQLMGSC